MRVRFPHSRSRPNQGSEVKYFLCDYLKLAEAHCVKLSKKVNHNQNVCHTLYLCSQTQGQGHNLGSEFKIRLSNYSEKYQSKFHETSQKDEASREVCHAS